MRGTINAVGALGISLILGACAVGVGDSSAAGGGAGRSDAGARTGGASGRGTGGGAGNGASAGNAGKTGESGTGGSAGSTGTLGSGGAGTSDSGSSGAGTGGAGASGAGGGVDAGGGWDPAMPVSGVAVRVRNRCPFPIWIHAASGANALQPDDAKLDPGQTRDYDAPKPWNSARVTAFKQGPRRGEADKVELNIGADGTIHYNITYVDWLELPAEMWGYGGNCGTREKVGCYVPVAQVLTGCPEPFLLNGARCIAARSYCLNAANQSSAYCHALDSAISACSQCPAGTTTQVYACSGPYGSNPRACAALNRGMGNDFDETDQARYYQRPPYNTYAKWVQTVCPGIYGFPYDDVHDKAGLRACKPTELRVTFCPGG